MARDEFADFMKGVLILLVVFGHVIQYAVYNDSGFWGDSAFKFIYMFHMPLFIVISGYFSYYSISCISKQNAFSVVGFLLKRFCLYIYPAIMWAFIFNFIAYLFFDDVFISGFVMDSIGALWFLWVLFACTFLVLLGAISGVRENFIFLVMFFLLFFVPEVSHFPLLKFMFPFFVFGCFLSKRKKYIVDFELGFHWLFLSFVVLCVSFYFWEDYDYIYVSGMKNPIDNFSTIVFRYLSCLNASFFVFYILRVVYFNTPDLVLKVFVFLGKGSIYVYIFQSYFFMYFDFSRFGFLDFYPLLLLFSFSISVLFCCFGFLLSKNNKMAYLFFGRD